MHFAPRLAFAGFAQFVTPKWQMVPVGGTRKLYVSGHGALVPRVGDPTKLTATQRQVGARAELTLDGLAAGLTHVEWVPAAAGAAVAGPAASGFRLDVSVKAERQISTAFFFVSDNAGHHTRRQIASIDRLVTGVNSVLQPQANVTVVKRSAAPLAMAVNLGRVVRFAAHLTGPPDNVPAAENEWDDLLAQRDPAADFNVFFVHEYEQDNTPRRDNTDGGTIAPDKMCIFEDNVGHPSHSVALAHEFVHGLGVSGHEANAIFLMATGANGIGRLLTRTHTDIINPSGT